MAPLVIAAVLVVLVFCLVLPIIALARTREIRTLERRLAGVEAALLRLMREGSTPPAQPPEPALQPAPQASSAAGPAPAPSQPWEAVIGQRWLGWIAVVLIFFAAAFFLKYAFENRWIGEVGRVALGIVAGLVFTWAGYERHRRGWPYFSQILTGGGVTLLYLSTYGASAYYRLIEQPAAFLFLVVVVTAAHLLALAYDARAIAVIALAGGFLVPVLLASPRDQYRALFGYIAVLDLGVLALVVVRRWRWVASLAFLGTHLLFWAWYDQHYIPEKRAAALLFQGAVFLLFLAAGLASHLRGWAAGAEEWVRSAANPFVFYANFFFMLSGDYRPWMGLFALTMAAAYAVLAWVQIERLAADRRSVAVSLGTALVFVTLAIPIQLEANWITIAWAAEALVLVWVASLPGGASAARPLRALSVWVFAFAVARHLLHDTPWDRRPVFTPVLNRYFLGAIAVTAALLGAAYLYRRLGVRPALTAALAAAGVLWLSSSAEVYSYFTAGPPLVRGAEAARQQHWAGQMGLSILWSAFAGALVAAGFRLRLKPLRSAGLGLFGLTLLKVGLVDIGELRQFYRIVALLALGLVLLAVAWAYQRLTARLGAVLLGCALLGYGAEGPEPLARWPYFKEIHPPAAGASWFDFVLDLDALDKTGPNHSDLRLRDAAGAEIPYVLRVRRQGETPVVFQAALQAREATLDGGRSASSWSIDFGGCIPLDRIVVTAADAAFVRPYRLEAVDDPKAPLPLAAGRWVRRSGVGSPDLVVEFRERFARRLRFIVTDDGNAPLSLLAVVAEAAPRQVIFQWPPGRAKPLRLYYGNPKAPPPHYDLEASLPEPLAPAPVRLTLGAQRENPLYRPAPKPLTERAPWLIYVVLGVAGASLAVLLLALARRAGGHVPV